MKKFLKRIKGYRQEGNHKRRKSLFNEHKKLIKELSGIIIKGFAK